MSTAVAVVLALAIGSLLTFAATRATANVQRGPVFLRWMIVVFVSYLTLIVLPVLVAS